MSDDGRPPHSWGSSPQGAQDHGLAGLFADPVGPQPAAPPDPALLAAQYQARLESEAVENRVGGAHRARRQPARYVLPAVIGALAVLAVVIGISGWFRDGDTATVAGPTNSQVSVPTPTPTPSVTPSVRATQPARTPTPTKPAPARTTVAPPPVVHAPAVVLNETTQTGLAGRVAARLQARGWTVTGTGNWRGNIGSTTVYYPPSLLAAARSLAHDLGISRIRPRVAGMLTDRLTVVLTSNPYA